MKPEKTFLFLFSILFILGILTVVADKINQDNWDSGLLAFSVPQTIDTQIKNQLVTKTLTETEQIGSIDTIFLNNESFPVNTIKPIENNVDSIQFNDKKSIYFPSNSDYNWSLLYRQLHNNDSIGRPVRIMYYGDSQIENDRITSAFRNILQGKYGGSGRGLTSVLDIYNSANNFVMSPSKNWERIVLSGENNYNQDVGMLCEAFRIVHNSNNTKEDNTNAGIEIKSLDLSKINGYSIASIFYKATGSSEINIYINEELRHTQPLEQYNTIKELRLNLGKTPEKIKFLFQTDSEITVYGISLESPGGIIVDNVALRGKAFPGFTRIDSSGFSQMAEIINPSFIILHFGVNVVPYVTNNYNYYKRQITNEINYLKKILPETPILLISASDMAQRINGTLQSYPNIEMVINAQKEAAYENGCAFWNLFETMGGKGSMIKWVETDPPQGNKDYVHFTLLGANHVGNLFAMEFLKSLEKNQEQKQS